MFLAHPTGKAPMAVSDDRQADDAAWLDLLDPTEAECALAGRLTGLRIPVRQDIEEIENSSRVYMENGTFYLSTPLVRRTEDASFTAPVGFVLGKDRLITIRYSDYPVFDLVGQRLARTADPHGAGEVMLLLLEAIIDRIADLLELVGRELDVISKRIFHAHDDAALSRNRKMNADARLRLLLTRIGKQTDFVSGVRDSLLGLQRVVLYLSDTQQHPVPERFAGRLELLSKDVASLNDYDGQLNNKVQFLLDATLGFINIEQNNGIKVLTVVSIVGIPPTLIASIYGMNFKNIPELNWSFGYWYALSLMAATVVLPMIWFWRKGWLGNGS